MSTAYDTYMAMVKAGARVEDLFRIAREAGVGGDWRYAGKMLSKGKSLQDLGFAADETAHRLGHFSALDNHFRETGGMFHGQTGKPLYVNQGGVDSVDVGVNGPRLYESKELSRIPQGKNFPGTGPSFQPYRTYHTHPRAVHDGVGALFSKAQANPVLGALLKVAPKDSPIGQVNTALGSFKGKPSVHPTPADIGAFLHGTQTKLKTPVHETGEALAARRARDGSDITHSAVLEGQTDFGRIEHVFSPGWDGSTQEAVIKLHRGKLQQADARYTSAQNKGVAPQFRTPPSKENALNRETARFQGGDDIDQVIGKAPVRVLYRNVRPL